MTKLKILQIDAKGDLKEAALSDIKGTSEHQIHPHTVLTNYPTDEKLSKIMSLAVQSGIDDLAVVQVGVGDPTSVPSGVVIPQETHVVRRKQPRIQKIA